MRESRFGVIGITYMKQGNKSFIKGEKREKGREEERGRKRREKQTSHHLLK